MMEIYSCVLYILTNAFINNTKNSFFKRWLQQNEFSTFENTINDNNCESAVVAFLNLEFTLSKQI